MISFLVTYFKTILKLFLAIMWNVNIVQTNVPANEQKNVEIQYIINTSDGSSSFVLKNDGIQEIKRFVIFSHEVLDEPIVTNMATLNDEELTFVIEPLHITK